MNYSHDPGTPTHRDRLLFFQCFTRYINYKSKKLKKKHYLDTVFLTLPWSFNDARYFLM